MMDVGLNRMVQRNIYYWGNNYETMGIFDNFIRPAD